MKRFKVAAVMVCACLILVACGTALPDVTGKTISQARGEILKAGFQVGQVTYAENATAAVGVVIAQDPAGGQSAKSGSVVSLTVAGPPPVPVPEVTGLSKAKAEATLGAAGLKLGEVTESYDASVSAGVVASQTPETGRDAPKGSAVALVVSRGPAPVVVPRVTGKAQSDAVKVLRASGFKVTMKRKDNKAKKGTVLAQRPASGLRQRGSTITITVSTGVVKPVPVLGQAFKPYSSGFGKAHPSYVWGGGDPTSQVSHIKWASWGGAKAIGHGTAVYAADSPTVADAPVIPATIVAWDLGMYHGHYIYRKVGWYFPQHGETFNTIRSSPYIRW